jgi:competence protein ComEA
MFKKLLAIAALLCATATIAAVDVNTATAAELDSIKGIGPGLSTQILDERKNGVFKDWIDLIRRVGGVGDKTAARFSAQGLTVSGQPFIPSVAAKATTKTTKTTKAPKSDDTGTGAP